MSKNDDEERELIAAVRNLLSQPQKLGFGEGQEAIANDPASELFIDTWWGERPEPVPVHVRKDDEIRALIESVARSGRAAERRKTPAEDPIQSLLKRIEGQGAGIVEEPASSYLEVPGEAGTALESPAAPSVVEEISRPEPEFTPAASRRHTHGGIRERIRGWRETDESGSYEETFEGVRSVDELGNLADLILPRSATFSIDELSINRNEHFYDFVDNARIVSEFDELFSRSYTPSSFAAAAAEVAIPAEEVPKPRFGVIRKFQVPGFEQKIEDYNPLLHGPLVDLTLRPSPGVEEIELYPVNEPYAYIRVTYDASTHEYTYHVIEPVLTPGERDLFQEIRERLFETLNITCRNLGREEARRVLRDAVNTIIADYGIRLDPVGREKVLYQVEREFLGDGLIDPIMHDKYVEDISCDGVGSAIFVYHTTYESLRTNLAYTDAAELDSFVTKLAQRAGKYISIAEPMLDATMNDGSRIQMTLGSEVTAHGSTFTIRKFRDEPITPTDLIEWHTFSPLGIAFLWLAVENGKSCIFAGGTASGKTTTLNAISLFIPPLAKIVTLEDTRELKLPHPNWIPSVTRDSFSQDGRGEIDMYELLRAALRQRPEYILVGEVRGREALTLFQAMSTGHVTYATMHADSVASAVHRLENPPIGVPRNMLSALDLMSIQVQARVGGQRIRRNKQLIEILDVDPRTNELITNEVFRWHPATDEIRYSGKSYILEQIMEDRGWSEERMREELKRRQEVLEWMRIKKIRHYQDVSKILISYFRDPEAVIQRVRADLYGEGGPA